MARIAIEMPKLGYDMVATPRDLYSLSTPGHP